MIKKMIQEQSRFDVRKVTYSKILNEILRKGISGEKETESGEAGL